ncbi:MAG: tyrosine-protein kinase [Acetobacteraceae bacterium]|jgi:Mrp family chromosome partitioning ATPase/uncharacterized protein involved in exopolysaccharide biosynthesis|nr:tyrosine-protein kinase [Acetobacteraceae bacterium]
MGDQTFAANFTENTIDTDPEFSFADILARLRRRKWTFALWVIIPMALALTTTALIPLTWEARTRILIRYGTSESAFLQDLIPDDRSAISGATASEIIRSLPTLEETIRRYDIHESDLYRDPMTVAFTRLLSFLPEDFKRQLMPDEHDDQAGVAALARTFQDSLEESSKVSEAIDSKTKSIAILSKDSTIPQAQKGDELITLTVRAFNRTRVAGMTNGLAATFIDQYYRLSAEDADRSFKFLSLLEAQLKNEVALLEQDPDAVLPSLSDRALIGGGATMIVRDNPEISQLNNRLATLEADLGRTRQAYRDRSPNIRRLLDEIAGIKRLLPGRERLAIAKEVLRQLENRRFQASNSERLYDNRLLPISIIEPATTPPASDAANVRRFAISGAIGLLIGSFLGVAVISALGMIDQRLFTFADVERSLNLPIFGWVPKLKLPRRSGAPDPPLEQKISQAALPGLLQILAHLDSRKVDGVGQVVAVTSAAAGDGKSLVSLQLAKASVTAGLAKVLLVDTKPSTRRQSREPGQSGAIELANAVVATRPLTDLCLDTSITRLHLLPAGALADGLNVGFHLPRLRHLFDEARRNYDLIIVDTPPPSVDGGTLTCGTVVDNILVIVKSGVTRRSDLRLFVRHLRELTAAPVGVVVNFRTNTLPGFMSRNL